MTSTVPFDTTKATTYRPRPVPKRVRFVDAAPDERTTIAAEWGGAEHFVGPWVAVLDENGATRYGVAHDDFLATHEQMPDTQLWHKTTTVDAYRHAGGPGKVATVLRDGLVETVNTVAEGDWLVRQKTGAVQVIADGAFRALYDVDHPEGPAGGA